jgi:hypothetical protein
MKCNCTIKHYTHVPPQDQTLPGKAKGKPLLHDAGTSIGSFAAALRHPSSPLSELIVEARVYSLGRVAEVSQLGKTNRIRSET